MNLDNYEILLSQIKDRFPESEITVIGNIIEGKIGNDRFTIQYDSKENISLKVNESALYIGHELEEIIPILTTSKSVLSYDTVLANSKREHNVIWSNKNPYNVLYEKVILTRLVPIQKFQTKIINVVLCDRETNKTKYFSDEELESFYNNTDVKGKIKDAINNIDTDKVRENAKIFAKDATDKANALILMLGGTKTIEEVLSDAKDGAKVIIAITKEKISDLKGNYNEQVLNLEHESSNQNDKIRGIYPGSLKSLADTIDSLDEIQIYYLYEDLTSGKFNYDIEEMNYAYYYIMYSTRKFGVKIDSIDDLCTEESTDSFKDWAQYYRSYFNNLCEEDKQDFNMRRRLGFDTSMYKPELSYNEYKKQIKLNRTMNN